MDYEKLYKGALATAKDCLKDGTITSTAIDYISTIFPELKESEDDRMKKDVKRAISVALDYSYFDKETANNCLAWLEKQNKVDMASYEVAENEKREFVGYGFLKCKGDFLSFKEGENYWLEYVGKDNYNVRSDNLLGQTFHITPQQLYTVFRPTTWLEKQSQTFTKKEVDDAYLKGICDAKHELEKQGKQKPFDYEKSTITQKDYAPRDYNEIDPNLGIPDWVLMSRKKPIDTVEPKFHEGEWIIGNKDNTVHQVKTAIENVSNGKYAYDLIDGGYISTSQESDYHLWTIADAKDGDVLACNEEILLFKSYSVQGRISVYCWYNWQTNNFHSIGVDDASLTTKNKICPATKEQRDLLFTKMEEVGYEWDAEKKELKKIEDEIEIPFGAKDSELIEEEYYIPKGFHAEIEADKVVIKKGEKPATWGDEDESCINNAIAACRSLYGEYSETAHWLKSLKDRVQGKEK